MYTVSPNYFRVGFHNKYKYKFCADDQWFTKEALKGVLYRDRFKARLEHLLQQPSNYKYLTEMLELAKYNLNDKHLTVYCRRPLGKELMDVFCQWLEDTMNNASFFDQGTSLDNPNSWINGELFE